MSPSAQRTRHHHLHLVHRRLIVCAHRFILSLWLVGVVIVVIVFVVILVVVLFVIVAVIIDDV